MTQPASIRCEDCGDRVGVEPTASAWEFVAYCPACGHRSVISWFHGSPPPRFDGGRQGELFR